MKTRVLTDYFNEAFAQSKIEKLEDGTFSGTIDACPGVIAFASTQAECEEELKSILEEWVLLGLRLGHHLPVIKGINLNITQVDEPLDAA